MKKILLISFMLMSTLINELWAQDRTVSGKVTDDGGEGIPGVNVILKGTITGVTSDIDGNYKLNVPADGGTLVYSFIGMATQEVEIGARAVIDISMVVDATELIEVVITALGTQQNAREVTYANQIIKAEDLITSPDKNALDALRGKTAGVKITTASGSVGASTRIVLRGESSLTGNNNALIVVDGIPIDNTSSVSGRQAEGGYADYGNRFNDFDPNNIANITILKGPSATSLYGSRAASGLILITTKTGSKGKMKVNFNTAASVEKAYILLQRQDQFGQGLINPDGTTDLFSGENFSWGPRFDGIVRPWTSPVDTDGNGTLEFLSRPYEAVPNQLQNFFRVGRTLTNSLAISGGNENYSYRISYANTDQKGTLENTDYLRHSVNVNTSANLSSKFKATLSLGYSYVDINTAFEGARAFEGNNPYASAVQAAVNIPYSELRDYKNPFHNFDGYYGSYTVNPYFALNENVNNAKSNNFISNVSLQYTPIDNLILTSKIGLNYIGFNRITIVPQYQYNDHLVWHDDNVLTLETDRQGNVGSVSEFLRTSRTIDWTSTASYSFDIQDDFKITATTGLNIFDVRRRNLFGDTQGGLVVPGIYNLGNSAMLASVAQSHSTRRIVGLFGNLSLGWNDKVFLEYSARNDWSSTLPRNNQSFFYQAIGASAIISEFADLSIAGIDYLKLRSSYGTTGKDAGAFLLNSSFSVNPALIDYDGTYKVQAPLNGQTAITRNSLIGNDQLKPELTKTFEVGADINLLKGKIEVAYSFYQSNHTEQIVISQLSRATGYRNTPVNIGEIQNQGHEVTLGLTPLNLQNGFKWKMNLTWSKNISKVIKISDQADNLVIYSSGRGVTLEAEVGQPYGIWKGPVPKLTPSGQPIVGSSGNRDYTTITENVGSIQPNWIGGIVNTFSYKGISLGFVLDRKDGGKMYSLTKAATEFNGTALSTLINDRKPFVIPNSVVENLDAAGDFDGTYSPNTVETIADAYVFDGNYTRHIVDASFLKLREVTVGYDLPKSLISKINLETVSIRVFGKNLKTWVPSENTFADPEVGGPSGNSNSQGIESTQTPTSRSYGVSLNIIF